MSYDSVGQAPQTPAARIQWSTFWSGALATAAVAALLAAVGELVSETFMDVELLPKDGNRLLGLSENVSNPAAAALLALLSAGILSLLLLGVPRPLTFFGWIMSLVGVIVAVAPFSSAGETSTQVATAVVALVVVVAIWSLLRGSARRAAFPR